MRTAIFPALVSLLACGGDTPAADSVADSSAPVAARTIAVSIPEGTRIPVSLVDPVSSAADKMGGSVSALVGPDVRDASGRIVVPPGSIMTLRIDEISGVTSVQARGLIRLSPVSVRINQEDVPLKGQVDSIPSRLVDRVLLVERATPLTVRLAAGLVVNVAPN